MPSGRIWECARGGAPFCPFGQHLEVRLARWMRWMCAGIWRSIPKPYLVQYNPYNPYANPKNPHIMLRCCWASADPSPVPASHTKSEHEGRGLSSSTRTQVRSFCCEIRPDMAPNLGNFKSRQGSSKRSLLLQFLWGTWHPYANH